MGNNWRVWGEGAIVGLLLAACLVLAALQYRWTGDLSRAEADRLVSGTAGRLQQFSRAFDAELRRSVADFVPSAAEIERLGPELASEQRFREASQRLDRPLFRRIAVAIPSSPGRLRFAQFDADAGKVYQTQPPASPDWSSLLERLRGMLRGDDPGDAIAGPDSALIEVPVFGGEGELEWVLLELDTNYAQHTWLPELVRAYMRQEGDQGFHVSIHYQSNPAHSVYSEPAGGPSPKVSAEASLFPLRFLQRSGREQDGHSEPGRWRVSVLRDADGVPAVVRAARLRNLTVAFLLLALIAAAGAALLRNTRQARRLAAAQFQFFAGVSHELRTPLTVIQGAAHNLLSGVVKDEPQRDDYVRAIAKQSAQLNEMVDQLLAYGAASRGITDAGASTTLGVAVSEAIESSAMELEQTRRSVDVDMPPDLPPVRGDQTTLRRVLGNLISNAVRHGGGEVKISAVRKESHVELSVADSGVGIPEEELQRVFEPFFRGEQARNGRTRGTGLGLSLVKESVERLGGMVGVKSKRGEGTVFTLRLPIAE